MTPQASDFLAKSHKLMAEAEAMITIDLREAAGRAAYLAGFHAAQALIFERHHRVFKTHRGVHGEFQLLTKDDDRIDPALRGFLSQTYNLKAVADYETGPLAAVSLERATDALARAKIFIARIIQLIDQKTA